MESWRKVWRDGIAPQLTDAGLEALAQALETDAPELLQGATTSPPPLACVQDWPVEAACPVGYAGFHANGRVSFPWCRPGYEDQAKPLFEAVLTAMRQRRMPLAFAAYRGDWPEQGRFFQQHGFRQAREMVNYFAPFTDMPTAANQRGFGAEPLTPADLPELRALAGNVVRARSVAVA